jgi:hypothetical protein
MQGVRRTVAWLSIVSVSTVSFCGGPTYAAHQKDSSCSEARFVMELECGRFNSVNIERGKPFIAEQIVTRVKSSIQLPELTEVVARDDKGRTREERHVPMGLHSSRRDTAQEPEELVVSILDCFGGQTILLRTTEQIAFVQEPCDELPAFQPSNHPYSYRLTQFVTGNGNPKLVMEDLGYRELQVGKARGIRFTWLGEEKDGDWNGKPKTVAEQWMSDELGVTVHWVYSDLQKQTEVRHTLQNVRREEPDASLFAVPSGYKVKGWSTMWAAVY